MFFKLRKVEKLKDIVKSEDNCGAVVVTDVFDKKYIVKALERELGAFYIEVEDSIRESIEYYLRRYMPDIAAQDYTDEQLILLGVKEVVKKYKKDLIINISNDILNDEKNVLLLKEILIDVYDELKNSGISLIVVIDERTLSLIDEVLKEKYSIIDLRGLKKDFGVEVALWVEENKCFKCTKTINTVIGIEVEEYNIIGLECTDYIKKLIKRKFAKELEELHIRKIDFAGSYICPYCKMDLSKYNKRIYYLSKYTDKKYVSYKEVKKAIMY